MSTSGKYLKLRIAGVEGVTLGTQPPGTKPLSVGVPGLGNPPGYPVAGMQRWSVSANPDELDATDAEHLGFTNTDTGCFTAEVTIDFVHRNATGPFPAFLPGAVILAMELYANSFLAGNPSVNNGYVADWQFPWSVVTRMTQPVEVRGQTKSTITLKSKSIFRGPGQPKWSQAELAVLILPANSPDV